MIALPIELDDALDALRSARDRLGYAVDALHDMGAPVSLVSAHAEAMEATSWAIERVSSGVASYKGKVRRDREMSDVEERHVDCQTFPWTEDL